MTKEEIIKLAKQAGFERLGHDEHDYVCYPNDIEEFAKLVAEKEREWKGLTDDEVAQAMYRADAIITGPMQFKFAKEIEQALKEKNT